MGLGKVQTALNFYTYGKGEFTRTGFEKHAKRYEDPAFHDGVRLEGKTFMVTGANSGLGKEISRYLASKGASLYMVCRSPERGEAARAAIEEETGNNQVHLLRADCGSQAEVRAMWAEFERKAGPSPTLDGLVCNAGALMSERTLNSDGVETTFAAHLAVGTYLLGSLAMPALKATPGSRVVVVTSGGAYNSPYPGWETITSTAPDSEANYDGNIAYSWAKRGQILLVEEWAKAYPDVAIVSAHPGWAATEGVDAALSDSKHLLEPLRSAWEGAEGMCWLLAAPASALQSGALYLDRSPQKKHIAGWFWTEGSRTKNSPDEVAMMMANLERFVREDTSDVWRPSLERTAAKLACRAATPRLSAPEEPQLDLFRFMGRWYVLANVPIMAANEHNLCNPIERYEWDEQAKRVQVIYRYYAFDGGEGVQSSAGEARQHGYINSSAKGAPDATWSLHPRFAGIYLPLNLGYLILHVAPDYSWTLIGVPDRKYLWIMTRARPTPKDPDPFPVAADRATVEAARQKNSSKEEGRPEETGEGPATLTAEDEAGILQEALLKAEAAGYDISGVRIAGWYSELGDP
jgi:dehydrogenase/reductase SDR family protein 12